MQSTTMRTLNSEEIDIVAGGQGGFGRQKTLEARRARDQAVRDACVAAVSCVASIAVVVCYRVGVCGSKKIKRVNSNQRIADCACEENNTGRGQLKYSCYCLG